MDAPMEKTKDSEALKFPVSSLKFLILKLLSKKPRYGYEIIKEIERKTDRKPSQGIIYPILHEFEEKGLVNATWNVEEKGPSRKYYYITAKGEEEFKKAKERLTEAFNALFGD
jgi:PadR family transcriptional regulator PadR